jgi:FkbM family methyltransferase
MNRLKYLVKRLLNLVRRLLNTALPPIDGPKPAESQNKSRYRQRDALILIPRLMDLLPEGERVVIVDGGAREVDRDARWRPFPPKRLRFIGFEPDKAEAERLNATPGPGGLEWQFIPAGLWGSSGEKVFEHNKASGGSSFLPQNREVTDRWKFENPTQISLAHEIFYPIGQETMRVVSLADWANESGVRTVDFIKLNVQGAEHEILDGAGPILDSALGILIEVAFVESYRKRPFFSDTDQFLRSRGFTFFDLLAHHYIGRANSPIAAQHLATAEPKLGQLVSAWGQLIEGHALYLKDPIGDNNAAQLDTVRTLKLIALAEAFGQIEYALELTAWLAARIEPSDPSMARSLRDLIDACVAEYKALL